MKKLIYFIMLIGFASIIFYGCLNSKEILANNNFEIDYSENWAVENVEGVPGEILKLGIIGSIKTLTPFATITENESKLINLFLDSLMYISNDGIHSKSGLAKSVNAEVTEDGSTMYTFELGDNIKWSDGEPLTIDDVIWTFKNIWFNPLYSKYVGIEDQNGDLPKIVKINDNTIRFIYNSKYRLGYERIASAKILPKHILENYVNDSDFENVWNLDNLNSELFVGSGPFIPKRYLPDEEIVFEKNPNYYRKDKNGNSLPYLNQIIYKIANDEDEMKNFFINGEIDIYEFLPSDYESIKNLSEEKNWEIIEGKPLYGTQFIAFNFNAKDAIKRQWFRNKYFRRAISRILDRDKIIQNVYYNHGTALYGPLSPSSFFYNSKVENLNLDYSVDGAISELDKGGFKLENGILYDSNGNQVTFNLITNINNTIRLEIGNILKEDLKKIGIEITFTQIEFNDLVSKLVGTGDWESVIIGFTGSVDPASSWNVWRTDGGLHFWNFSPEIRPDMFDDELRADYVVPEYEKRIDEIMRLQVETYGEELENLFNEFQLLVSDNQILVYTASPNYLAAYNKNIHVYNIDSPTQVAGILWKIWNIWKEH
ncbi:MULTISPECIES: ABC transporter substrate-binding protein [unclassified Marinitoga]|uniref:ABC transporter substrate-binding protein n=1 Tax=unclassified Marinitoga TaxID=2640159 RepID=UPI0006410B03|nr:MULTISPECIES: ABC transporter substrate-binding protein [unclassified Marinitoga]KLO24871.1 peptide ABC transporter substrate-binding protein [Marinitoga sp. 1155]NUU99040.1 hypothetical protein [Marinitoga sp. 1154]